jgi:hypothetical protein
VEPPRCRSRCAAAKLPPPLPAATNTASCHRRRAAAAATVAAKILKNIFGDVYVCRCASLVTVKKFKIWDKLIRNYKGS